MGVGFVDKLTVLLVGSEAGIHVVVVSGGVAVICGEGAVVGRVILQHGREPEGSDAELVEVVEMLANAFEVASVTQRGLFAVLFVFVQPLDFCGVVRALCEAVGHKHIKDVGAVESDAFVACFLAFAELVLDYGLVVASGAAEGNGQFACLHALEVEIDKEVVGRVEPHYGIYFRAIDIDLCIAYAGAIDH